MATSEEKFTGRAIEFRPAPSLYRRRQKRASSIGGDCPTIGNTADHSVKMNVAARQNQNYVSCVITRVVKPEPNHRGLSVFMLDRFKRKVLRIGHVGLCVCSCSLRIGHCFGLLKSNSFYAKFTGAASGARTHDLLIHNQAF